MRRGWIQKEVRGDGRDSHAQEASKERDEGGSLLPDIASMIAYMDAYACKSSDETGSGSRCGMENMGRMQQANIWTVLLIQWSTSLSALETDGCPVITTAKTSISRVRKPP